MKHFFSLLVALLFCGNVHAELTVAHEYVSVDCPKGDITLIMNNDGTFSLELKHWDSKKNIHTQHETFSGKWRLSGKKLILSSAVEVSYERNSTSITVGSYSANIDSFTWERSSKPTFVDTFSLVERKTLDNLFQRSILK
jgi:hypothetical protein